MIATVLESERLIYKPLDRSFTSQAYVDWMNDSEVNRFMESGGDYTLQKLEDFLHSIEQKAIFFWAIITKEGKHIGNIKIDPINWRNKVGEYGIMLGDKSEWGKGYAREASEKIIEYCFSEKVNLRKITLGVVEDNLIALSLYKKMSFIIEGTYESHAYHLDKWCNVIRMAMFNPHVV